MGAKGIDPGLRLSKVVNAKLEAVRRSFYPNLSGNQVLVKLIEERFLEIALSKLERP